MIATAVVTGASSGIGAACAHRLLREGWQVAALARRADPLSALAEEFPGRVLALPTDLVNPAALAAAAARIAAWTSQLDAVVCSAGDFLVCSMEAASDADFERLWRLTVWSRFALVRALLPQLVRATPPSQTVAAGGANPREARGEASRQGGASRAIIHIASLAAHRDFPGETAYTAAMHGVIGLARAQDAELRARGIRAAVVSPGTVRTPLTERSFPPAALAGALAPEAIAQSVLTLVTTIAAGGYIPEIVHLPQNST